MAETFRRGTSPVVGRRETVEDVIVEEVGELATALTGDDRANLEEEFADVIAWLCTLANISDVDLANALERKYLSKGRPKGHK